MTSQSNSDTASALHDSSLLPHRSGNAQANGLELAYETYGDPTHPALILIMGLGAQLIEWPEDFVALLVDQGFYVIRFDNRDAGCSTKLDHLDPPPLMWSFFRSKVGMRVEPPYRVKDMAADTVALLDALDIEAAHWVGLSMGGMITQQAAIDHPHRLLSLTSIMSSTSRKGLPGAGPDMLKQLLKSAPKSREGLIQHLVTTRRMLGSKAYPVSDDEYRKRVVATLDRGRSPKGYLRQLAAISFSGGRAEALTRINVPSLVIHGDADDLVPLACGQDTADHIPNAQMEVVAGMGHELHPPLFDMLTRRIAEHAHSATKQVNRP